MKKFLFLITILFSLYAVAQKTFDSAAYVQFYEARWDKLSFGSIGSTPFPKTLSTEEKLFGLSKCWSEAKYNFGNFDLIPQTNWDSLYQAFIPRVTTAKTTIAYYNVLQNFFQYLHDGHTRVVLPYLYRNVLTGVAPLQVRWIENKAVVTKNTTTDAAEKAVVVGDELVAINGEPLQHYIQTNISPYLHFSTPQDSTERIYRYELFTAKPGDVWNLRFRKTTGNVIEQKIRFQSPDAVKQEKPLLQFSVLPGNVGYLQLHSFGDEKIVSQFDSIFPALSKTASLIIDVRDNGGGNGGNGFEILGYLTDKPFYTGKNMVRQYRPVGRSWGGVEKGHIEEDTWRPYKNKLYSGPVVVLTSGATYSAAEDFTATYKNMKRGAVIGEPSGGSTGQPVFFTLPGGGLGAVCSKRDYFSNGTEFIGIGIQPDVVVHPTIKSLLEGRDDAVEAAVQYLKNTSRDK